MGLTDAELTTGGIFLGVVFTAGIQWWSNKKKSTADTDKVVTETIYLGDKEQREKGRFCEDQLSALEKRYKIQQEENDKLSKELEELTIKFKANLLAMNQMASDIIFLRLELAAYKP